MKVNLPRYEKIERLCLSRGTSDILRTVGVASVLAHCTVIHSDKWLLISCDTGIYATINVITQIGGLLL